MAWTSVITNAGLSLLAAGKPHVQSVWGGSGTVKEAALLAQTGLAEPKQQGSIVAYEAQNKGSRLKLQFGAAEAEYQLQQIGIFASLTGDEAGEPVLFALIQNPEGVKISANADWPSFVYTHYCQLNIANAEEFTVNIDGGALVSMSTLQEQLKPYIQLDESGKIPDNLLPDMDYIPTKDKGKAGGVASLGADGKIPLDQLIIDAALSATSGNPVQNKVVQAAINTINNALAGKAAGNHTHNYAGSNSAGGAANSAVKLQTARSIHVNLGSTGAASFDGSGNANPGIYGILGVGSGGTGANNAAGARANLGINLANLGGCRIVTGTYAGNNSLRTGADIYGQTALWSDLRGGQFINLGVRPQLVIVVYFALTKHEIYLTGEPIVAIDSVKKYAQANNRNVSTLVNNTYGVPIDIVDGGFYVGNYSTNSAKDDINIRYYGYLAII